MADYKGRRRHIRYNPDKNSILTIIPHDSSDSDELIGLLRDVSKGGCGGIFHRDYFKYTVADIVEITTDDLRDTEAKVIWEKGIDKQFLKVGFEFTEKVNV